MVLSVLLENLVTNQYTSTMESSDENQNTCDLTEGFTVEKTELISTLQKLKSNHGFSWDSCINVRQLMKNSFLRYPDKMEWSVYTVQQKYKN